MTIYGSDLFRQNPDGSIEPTKRIKVQSKDGSAEFGPGVRLTRGVQFGGVNAFDIFEGEFEGAFLDDGSVVIELR